MDAATWATLNRLLEEALDRPPAERAAWLESLAPEVAALAPHLRELLQRAAAVETGDFLGTLPKFGVSAADGGAAAIGSAGETVGKYRLVRELGSGGMGTVWLAERTDGLINRPVALKLPHLVAARPADLAGRMAREREILATLDHRNIARLLDAGMSAEGQPYLALEFVEGIAIDRFCAGDGQSPPLDVRERLRLFRQVADAVAYAHGKLVVHRDLKPANILVTAGGGVKLLDFGIAKLLDEGTTRETRFTQMFGRALTPDYASPEQILGGPLTVASDVYSLGVILYELLAGVRPYKLKRDSRGALEDAILQAEPPSFAVVAPKRDRSALRGDLDTIVRKALKKQPAERYATVNAFVDDIVRHLESRPVLAQADSRWYRVGKFIARNRLMVGTAALMLFVVIAGAGIALWQARVAIAERDRAEEVKLFITSIFRDADPYQDGGAQLTGAALLRSAQQRVESQFADRPELRTELLSLVGSGLKSLSDLPAAERALTQAVAESTRIHGETHLHTVRARVMLADVYNARRDTDKLGAQLEELLPLAQAVEQQDVEPLVMLKIYSGDYEIERGQYKAATLAASEALELARGRLGDRHPLTVQASTLRAEAMHFEVQGTGSMQAVEDSDRGLAFALAAYPDRPDHPQVLYMRNVRGRALGEAGLLQESIEEKQRSLAGLHAALGEDNVAVANAELDLSNSERRIGRTRDAVERAARAVAIIERHVMPDSRDRGTALNTYGLNLAAARRQAHAAQIFTEAQRIFTKALGARRSTTVSARYARLVSIAYLRKDDEVRAELAAFQDDPELRRAIPLWAGNFCLAIAHRQLGEPEKAIALHQESLKVIKPGPKANAQRVRVHMEIGLAELDRGHLDEAEAALDEAHRLFKLLKYEMSPDRAETIAGLGRLELARRAPQRAIPWLEPAHEFWQAFDASNPTARDTAHWLGRAYVQLGRRSEGEKLLALSAGVWR